jgi:hypothetical protein
MIEDSDKPSNCLFGELPAFLPALTPGETLFSWCARYHRLSGNVHAAESSLQLFGDKRAGLRHDFPSHLDSFAQITDGLLGDTALLARERTLLGFFSPFLDEYRNASALTMMRGSSVARLKNSLGVLPSRVGAVHPLKACRACMAADLREFEVTRWHIELQWPSVWVCRRHATVLQMFRNLKELKSLRRYILPEDVGDAEWLAFEVKRDKKKVLRRVAEFSDALIAGNGTHFNAAIIRYAAIKAAAARHWVASDGSLRFQEVREAFADYYRGLEVLPGFTNLTTIEKESGGLLGLMLRRYEGTRHPSKQIMMLAFFFDSPDDFYEAYRHASIEMDKGKASEYGVPLNRAWRIDLRRVVEQDNKSLSQAARELDVPLAQVVRCANKDGIEYHRRPRVLSIELQEKIRRLVAQGRSRDEIVRESGVKASFLRAYLARNPAIREVLRSRHSMNELSMRRDNFLLLINQNKGVPISHVKRFPKNGYAWLLRHDREWLLENIPGFR